MPPPPLPPPYAPSPRPRAAPRRSPPEVLPPTARSLPEAREPEPDLAGGRVVAVARVDQVLGGDRGEVAPDGARLGVLDLRRPHQLAHQQESVLVGALDHRGEHGRADQELDQIAEEGLVPML